MVTLRFLVFAVGTIAVFSTGIANRVDDRISSFAESSGSTIFVDVEGRISGIVIPSHRSGFQRDLATAKSIIGEDKEQAPARYGFINPCSNAMESLKGIENLKWLVYFGNGVPNKYSERESKRVSDIVDALDSMKAKGAVGFFDCDFDESSFMQIMSFGMTGKILFVDCDVKLGSGLVKIDKLSIAGSSEAK